jgi:hypothetical protein
MWVGIGLLVVAASGFLLNRSPAVVTAFAVLGTAAALFSVFEPRMEGQQHVGAQGVTFNLDRARAAAAQADEALAERDVYTMEDLP